jgi:hypothetical protein
MTLSIAADNLEPLKPIVAQALEALDPHNPFRNWPAAWSRPEPT